MIPPVQAAIVVHHDLAQHEIGLVILVEGGLDGHLLTLAPVGPQCLALAALIVADNGVSGIENMLGGAIVLLQSDGAGAGVLLFKIKDILNVGTAETIDTLVIVAHHTDVAIAAGQQGRQTILQMVGILILVNQHIAKTPAIVIPHFSILLQQMHRLQNQIIEVQRIGTAEPIRVKRIDFTNTNFTPIRLFLPVFTVLLRAGHLLFGMRNRREYLADRKRLLIQIQFFQAILDHTLAVICIVDGKVAAISDAVDIAAQNTHTGRMEGGGPYITALLPQHPLQAFFQLVGSLVGKGDGQHLMGLGRFYSAEISGQRPKLLIRVCRIALQKLHLVLGDSHRDLVAVTAASIAQEVCNTVDQYRCLSATGSGKQQQRPLCRHDSFALFLI